MKRWLCPLLLLLLLLCGCEALPYPRELEETMLVRVLGVDRTSESVTLTAADVPGEGEEVGLRSATGETMETCRQVLREMGEESVALTHVTQVVVGAGSDLETVLEELLLDREVGQTATVWLAAGEHAQTLMERVGGGAKRLSSIELNVAGLETRTVLDALASLEETGSVTLPLLEEKNGTLEVAGQVIWKEGWYAF